MMTDMPAEYIGHVVSNPRAELPVNNAKYIRNCTELHMARRKIEYLWGFHLFVNLEELWLNDNKVLGGAALLPPMPWKLNAT